jgi:lysophospholipase L1-like esterase
MEKMIDCASKRGLRSFLGGGVIVLLVVLIGFNIYYFFIKRGVGPDFYYRKLVEKPVDRILEDQTYQDFVREYEYLNTLHNYSKCIVFVGDSIIARFKVGEYSRSECVLNRGIYSDTTMGLINRMEKNCNNLNISMCFLLIGYNDLKYREDNEILNNIEAILRSLKADRIYVMSLLPVGRNYAGLVQRVSGVNMKLKEVVEARKCAYVDLFSKMVANDGFIRSDLTADGVHPNGRGYAEIWEVIKEYIDDYEKKN